MISILMPAYIDSVEKLEFLNEAIRSLKSQTLQDWELLLVDDCSPYPISIAEPDDRIRQFRTVTQSGPALCRNTAAALALNECLLPFDSDDLLGSTTTLEHMYGLWAKNTDKIIYGHLQRLELKTKGWELGKVAKLPDYTFKLVLNPKGVIPVTGMHSIECHQRAGGWKAILDSGLEDLEYWIAAGKAGFCGLKIDEVTLIYRRHNNSRSANLRNSFAQETEMRRKIRNLHEDVFSGRFPMGCCGGGGSYMPPTNNQQASSVASPTTLNQVAQNEKIWIEYVGKREGSFGMVGKFSNIGYDIKGPGHKLEVHVKDLPIFKGSGRGNDFIIGVPAPTQTQQTNGSTPFIAQPPQLATIERLDG